MHLSFCNIWWEPFANFFLTHDLSLLVFFLFLVLNGYKAINGSANVLQVNLRFTSILTFNFYFILNKIANLIVAQFMQIKKIYIVYMYMFLNKFQFAESFSILPKPKQQQKHALPILSIGTLK